MGVMLRWRVNCYLEWYFLLLLSLLDNEQFMDKMDKIF